MKQTKTIFFSALLTLIAFGAAITYTSCSKNPCSGVTCLNGGACNNGSCVCPTGYVGSNCGTLATTTITYNNDTYTPVAITVNGSTSTIPVGSNISYTGQYGDTLYVTAVTSGTAPDGTLAFNGLSAVFPPSGTSVIGIDVSSDYFFLEVTNNNATNTITTAIVNYNSTVQTTDIVNIPNNGQLYGVGYYQAYNNTEIRLNGSGGIYETISPFLTTSFTANQSYTFLFD